MSSTHKVEGSVSTKGAAADMEPSVGGDWLLVDGGS